MDHWVFVAGAYALVATVLLAYWVRLERRLRAISPPRIPAAWKRP